MPADPKISEPRRLALDDDAIGALLAPSRAEIDRIDDRLVDLLAQRFAVIERVARIKSAHGIAAILPDRVAAVKKRVVARAAGSALDPAVAHDVWTLLIDRSCSLEAQFLGASE